MEPSRSGLTRALAKPSSSLEPSENIANQCSRIGEYYYFTPSIGEGSYSKVFIGHRIDCKEPIQYVAIKRIKVSDMKKLSIKRIQREIELLKVLNHPNIVKFYEAFSDISGNIYIVTEYCNYGDLGCFIGKKSKSSKQGIARKRLALQLTPDEIKDYLVQFRDGLKYLLAHNILHRDIKPQNILLHKSGDKVTLKIADFGFAKAFESLGDEAMMNTLCGTPMYLAPEIVKARQYAITSDLWSVGVIIYELFYHTTPFKRPKNILELMRNLEEMDDDISFPTNVDTDLEDLITSLLQIDPHRRISWGNFFNHDWFGVESEEIIPLDAATLSCIYEGGSSLEKSVAISTPENLPIPEDIIEMINEDKRERENSSIVSSKVIYDDDLSTHLRQLLTPTRRTSNIAEDQISQLFYDANIIDNYTPSSTSVPIETRVGHLYGRPAIGASNGGNMQGRSMDLDYIRHKSPESSSSTFTRVSSPMMIPHNKPLLRGISGHSPVLCFLSTSLNSSMSYISSSLGIKTGSPVQIKSSIKGYFQD